MQKPEELVEVAQLLRKEMSSLGVEELETSSIYIVLEDTEKNRMLVCYKKIGTFRKRTGIRLYGYQAR